MGGYLVFGLLVFLAVVVAVFIVPPTGKLGLSDS